MNDMDHEVKTTRAVSLAATIVLMSLFATVGGCEYMSRQHQIAESNNTVKRAEQMAAMVKAGADPMRAACAMGVLDGSLSRDQIASVGCQGK